MREPSGSLYQPQRPDNIAETSRFDWHIRNSAVMPQSQKNASQLSAYQDQENLPLDPLASLKHLGLKAIVGSSLWLTAFGIALFSYVDLKPWLIWTTITTLVLLFRTVVILAFSKITVTNENRHFWLNIHLLGTFMTGLSWGIGSSVFFPHDPYLIAIITVLLTGTMTFSAATWSNLPRFSTAFIFVSILPFVTKLFMTLNTNDIAIGILLLVYATRLIFSSRKLHRSTVTNLLLNNKNLDLENMSEEFKQLSNQLNESLVHEITERHIAEQKIIESEKELTRVLDNMQDTYYRTNMEGTVIRVSPSVKMLLGYTQSEFIGQKLASYYLYPQQREHFLKTLNANNGVVRQYSAPLRHRSGKAVWVSTNAQYVFDENNNIIGVEGTTRDISELKLAEQALLQEKEKAQTTLSSIGDAVITIGQRKQIVYMNPVAENLTGCKWADATDRNLSDVVTLIDEKGGIDSSSEFLLEHNIQHGHIFTKSLLIENNQTKDRYSVESNVSDLKNHKGEVIGSVIVFRDISEIKSLAMELSYQATHDSLTGLYNRTEFERRLTLSLADVKANSNHQYAMMYLDLDQFKIVNDTCGHNAGDELLKQITSELKQRVREEDLLARIGGDEFGLLLHHCSMDNAESMANDLINIIKSYKFCWNDSVFQIGVSIGLTAIHDDSLNISQIFSTADSACYVAKDLGRNRVHVYHKNDEAVASHHGQMQWMQQIRQALDENRFVLYRQKVKPVSSDDDHVLYHEILIRMIDSDGTLIPPNKFIPAAERYQLMLDIDRWVINKAFSLLSKIKDISDRDLIAINLSGQSLANDGLLEYIVQKAEQYAISMQRICFEITESAAISNLAQARTFIATLREKGCLFALDDFGSGLSSFGYLKHMPIDYLKIDGQFVCDLANDPIHYAMVESINNIGHVFGIKTIAEFVEDAETLKKLQVIGIDYAQGFVVDKPSPLHEEIHNPTKVT